MVEHLAVNEIVVGSNPTARAILRQAQDFMYNLYILECDKAFFYTGITSNLEKRINEHKNGYSPHTRRYKVIELVYKEMFSSRDLAEKREKQIKGWTRAKKKALIAGNLGELQQLSKR